MWSRDALLAMKRKSPDEMLYSLTNREHTTGSSSYKRIDEPATRRKEMVECKYNAAQVDEVIVADLKPGKRKHTEIAYPLPPVYTG
jgi:hypothetical protein